MGLAQVALRALGSFGSGSPSDIALLAATLLASWAVLFGVRALWRVLSSGAIGRLVRFWFPPGSVDLSSSRNGGELVAEVLKEHGVKFLFTLVGGHISPILVESEKQGIRVIDVRHEVTAVFAADAVARLTGVPGVAAVTAGPGLTNTVTAVKNAQMAESPLVLIGGAAATMLKGRGALQDIDQMSLFLPICKWVATVDHVRDIAPVMREAFRQAREGTPGPVFVEFPIDTLYPAKDVLKAYGAPNPHAPAPAKPAAKPKGLMASIVQMYLNQHVRQLFAGAWDPHQSSPLPFNTPLASAASVEQAARLLEKAQRPLILVGSQATLPPVKPAELQAALHSLHTPCFLGGMARGLLGRDSEWQIRQQRSQALREADVIVLAGIIPDFRLDYGRHFNKKAKVIAVNRNPEHLSKNTDLFWKPVVSALGDPAEFLVRLAREVKPDRCSQAADWAPALRERQDKREAEIAKMAEAKLDSGRMNPLRLLQGLERVLDPSCVLVADGGDIIGSAAYIIRPRGPLKWLDPGAFGTLGVGGGFALGAKLACPELNVVVIYGDGSLGYSIAEFDTFTRHKIPIMAITGNDACWSQIAREQVPMFNSSVACDLAFTEYHVVAQGYGGKGLLLERESDVERVVQDAYQLLSKGHPVLINAIIGKTSFREGSISV